MEPVTPRPYPAWLDRTDLDALPASFARMLHRRALERTDAATADALARIGALLCLERARGHSCVFDDRAGDVLPLETASADGTPPPRLPDPASWARALEVEALVARRPGATAPLIARGDGSVALRRDDVAERRLARTFTRMLRDPSGALTVDGSLVEAFGRLFPEAAPVGQALAAAAALRSRLCVITGGPGTGKTTTVVRILALLLEAAPGLRIAVAAPTGKAAARLQASIDEQREGLEVEARVREALRLRVRTAHALLGYRPDLDRFTRGAHVPLQADVVVVDEASMLDLGLVDALVAALPAHARLILLGDRDQLASVDAGSVLADLVAAHPVDGDARSAGFADWAGPLFASTVPVAAGADARSDAVVELRHNFRFRSQRGIAELARALREGDADLALEILDAPELDDAVRSDPPARVDGLAPRMDELLERLGPQHTGEIASRLRTMERGLRILTAVRRGAWGVEGLNALAERRLSVRGWRIDGPWYEGRPVLVTRNAPALDLHNGDLGVVVDVGEGRRALVLGEGDRFRRVAPSRLPEHETAWAMTVHKSQGSEFDHVVLVLPPGRHPLLSRELLYTGVTRARGRVTVIGREETVRAAVEQVERRRSGLVARLREAWDEEGSGPGEPG